MSKWELIAPCHFGMEAVLKRENLDLGYEISKVEDGKVTFWADEQGIADANVFLRTTERILLKVADVHATTFEELFDKIESSLATSSNPADYIDAHSLEYRELTYYGQYSLNYIFNKFIEGEQTGLRGQLMRILLDDLAPEAQLRLYAENGQEYFDEWAAGAVRVLEQHDMEWMKENQPAMWIYLQMVE